jgi:tetratricopeptide (TPR) repeat protein
MSKRERENRKIQAERWLNSADITAVHQFVLRSKLAGTCNWIWAIPWFERWSTSSSVLSSERLLCIYGTPGCGKSVLASSVVEGLELKEKHALSFSFSGNHSDRQNVDSLLRGFLWQLLRESSDERVLDVVWSLCVKGKVQVSELHEAFLRTVGLAAEPVYCVIDGVDECNDAVPVLLDGLHGLLAARTNIRVILFSRPAVKEALENAGLAVDIDTNLVRQDIRAFINAEIPKSKLLSKPHIRDVVFQTLERKSDGMFLWVKLMIEDLKKSVTEDEVMKRLNVMPRGLEETYRLLYSELFKSFDPIELSLAKSILVLAIASCRPLTIDELRYAHALHVGSASTLDQHLPPDDTRWIVKLCGNMIDIVDNQVQLVHFSVREFLTRPEDRWLCSADREILPFRVDLEAAHGSFAWLCTDYLAMSKVDLSQETSSLDQIETQHPLLNYASRHVLLHFSHSGRPCPIALDKFARFANSETFTPFLTYLTMRFMEDESVFFILDDFQEFGTWLSKGGNGPYGDIIMSQVLKSLEHIAKPSLLGERLHLHVEKWQLALDAITATNKDNPHKPTTESITRTCSRTYRNLSRMRHPMSLGITSISSQQQLDIVLGLHSFFIGVNKITDPLKMLFRIIMQKASSVSVWVLLALGRFQLQLRKYQQAIEAFETALIRVNGQGALAEYLALLGLCVAFLNVGEVQKSEDMGRRALEIGQKILKEDHIWLSTSEDYLSAALEGLGKYEEAEKLCRLAVITTEKAFGKKDLKTLTLVERLARLLIKQNKEEAETMSRRVLEGRLKKLGKEHNKTCQSFNDVGNTLYSKAAYDEAEKMFRQAVEGCIEARGSEDPDELTLVYISNLAEALRQQRKNNEAEQAYRRVVEGRLKILGKEHRDTQTSTRWLCNLLEVNGKNEEAADMYGQVLEGLDKGEGETELRR